jgi:hypothetical protein
VAFTTISPYVSVIGPEDTMMETPTSPPQPSQLSFDVLFSIFTFISPRKHIPNIFEDDDTVDDDTFDDNLDMWRSSARSLAFSQVCRHWRQVALAIPSIWSTPFFRHQSLGMLMLDRAEQAPLTIVWPPVIEREAYRWFWDDSFLRTLDKRAWSATSFLQAKREYSWRDDKLLSSRDKRSRSAMSFVQTIGDHVQHIEALDVEVHENDQDLHVICEHVVSHSRILSKLHICVNVAQNDEPVWYRFDTRILDFRKIELSARATAFTHLSLTNCFVHFPAMVMQHLTSLSLDLGRTDQRISQDELLNLIKAAPFLESISLSSAIGEASNTDDPSPNWKPIELSQLRFFFVDDVMMALMRLLENVGISAAQTCRISIQRSYEDIDGSGELTTFMKMFLQDCIRKAHKFPRFTVAQWDNRLFLSADTGPAGSRCPADYVFLGSLPYWDPYETGLTLRREFMPQVITLITQTAWLSLRILEIQLYDFKLDYGSTFDDTPPRGFPFGEHPKEMEAVPSRQQCIELLTSVPQLEMLKLIGDTAGRAFLSALTPPRATSVNDDVEEPSHVNDTRPSEEDDIAESTASTDNGWSQLCPALRSLHLYEMSLALGRGDLVDQPNDIIDSLEVLLSSRYKDGRPIVKLRVTEAELQDDTPEEEDGWRHHFERWVMNVHLDSLRNTESDDDNERATIAWVKGEDGWRIESSDTFTK